MLPGNRKISWGEAANELSIPATVAEKSKENTGQQTVLIRVAYGEVHIGRLVRNAGGIWNKSRYGNCLIARYVPLDWKTG